MKTYTKEDVLAELRRRAKETSQTEVAAQLQISVAMVNDLIHERRSVSPRIARLLGFELMYRKIA